MSTGLILLVLLAVAVGVYFVFFNSPKIEYSEDKIKEVFKATRKLLTPDDGDHELIKARKEKMLKNVNAIELLFDKKPSMYTRDEIEYIDKAELETKKDLSDLCCDKLEKLIPLLNNTIMAGKKVIDQTQEAIKLCNESNEKTDEDEDGLDALERILEKTADEVKQSEEELTIIKNNIKKYKII